MAKRIYIARTGGCYSHSGHIWTVGTNRRKVEQTAVRLWNERYPDSWENRVGVKDLDVEVAEIADCYPLDPSDRDLLAELDQESEA